ncbi:MAG: tetratricopeptide repeat protein [Parachlamydiaceae bacterium]|nr:tetratricopeptide repeat protein [Parachlamydiaceae bacterium]
MYPLGNHRPPISPSTSNQQFDVSTITSKAKPLPSTPTRGSKNSLLVNEDISRTAQAQIPQPLSRASNPLQGKVNQQSIQTKLCQSKENVLPLLQQKENICVKDLSNASSSPLTTIEQGLQILLEYKADLSLTSSEQEMVFNTAVSNGFTKTVEDLLLKYPNVKQLIYAKDQDGKTPLHKALAGSSKPEMITLLIANGANVNAIDNFGLTPLHLAATNRQSASVAILLKHGAKSNLVNFDLVIRQGTYNFIHTILQSPQEFQKQKFVQKDIEGHHYKLLLAAKEKGLLEEQILHLQIIGFHYIEKKDFLKGAKLLNASLALLYQLPTFDPYLAIFEQRIFEQLEQIEAMFLETKGLKLPINPNPLADHRNQLKKIRKDALISQEKGQAVQHTLANLTTAFKTLLKALITEAQKILGPPPVEWACMGMGSMSRDEMCPYSDIEFAFLIHVETNDAMKYFRTLSQILELRIINLGETKFPVFGDKYPSPTPDGFCMDAGGNTPLGVANFYELIGTPSSLAQFQTIQWMDNSIILPNVLSHVCLVAGKERLVNEYTKAKIKVQKLIEKEDKLTEKNQKNHEVLAMRLLRGHTAEFSPDLSQEKEKIKAFGIKKELYRPIQEIIASLALFYQLNGKTTFNRIDELVNLNVFSASGARNLRKAINQVLTLRLKAHLFYKNEEEFLCHPEEGKPLDRHLMYLDEETLKILQEIYQVIIPFHHCGEKFLTSQSKKSFKSSDFLDKSFQVQALDFGLQPSQMRDIRQQAVSLNPNDEMTLMFLAVEEGKMGNYEHALQTYLKVLEFTKKKHGEISSNAADIYATIAVTYGKLMLFEKELEYHLKGMEVRLQVYGENHFDVAKSYTHIGLTHEKLGNDKQAQEYYHMTLKVQWIVLKEDPDKRYAGIAWTYRHLKDFEKALNYYHLDLVAVMQLYGENDYSVALIYNNIGDVYYKLENYKKALEFHQKALINRLNAEKNNRYADFIAKCHNLIGDDFRNLGDFLNALDHFKMAAEILCGFYKQSHPDILNSLKSLLIIAEKLQPLQHQNLKPLHILCVDTLGTENELTKALLQLII